jgi:uncharacterized protein with GYD domain
LPKYVVLFNFTQKRVETIKDMPNGLKKSMEIMKSHGLKMEQLVFTMGRYDVVGVFEAPDAETMSKALLDVAGLGLVRSETLRGFTPEEMVEMVKSLP